MAKAKGIFKRAGSPYLWIRWTGADGKQKKESTKTTLKAEAEYILSTRRKLAMEGIIPLKKKGRPFDELAHEYLEWAKRQRSYRQKAEQIKLLKEEFKGFSLKEFTTKAVEQYQSKRLEAGKKPATVNKAIAIIKHMFTKAEEWGWIDDLTLKGVHRVKNIQENNMRLKYLEAEQEEALISNCKAHLKPVVITALKTGMRKSEILGLTWDRVDLRNSLILLDKTKNGERREIHIVGTLRAVLEGLAMENVDGHSHVFHDKKGRPYKDVKHSFGKTCTDSGIKDFVFHDLRHSFASKLVMGGVDITTVKELLGHKTLTMTLRYAHLAPSHMMKALEVLDLKNGVMASNQK
ncbi:MAG: site-specific integrase [Nitrospirota bacterium]